MVRLTKAQRKDRERIEAWKEKKPFKENARDKDPQVPKFTPDEVLDTYVPQDISDGAKFYTPREMAYAFWALGSAGYLNIIPGMSVLEPCAGIGNLLYPFYDGLEDWDWVVDAYELDKEACEIGAKLFPNRVSWHNESPFEDSVQLEGLYDLVIMNPPLRIKWANEIGSEWLESGATNSEYRFLELAIRALKPGGQLMVIAPYNYIDRLPKGKGVKAWFAENAKVTAEFGKLPSEFQFTKIQAFGFLIERNITMNDRISREIERREEESDLGGESADEVIMVDGDSIRQSEIPDGPFTEIDDYEQPEPEEPTNEEMVDMVMHDLGAVPIDEDLTAVKEAEADERQAEIEKERNLTKEEVVGESEQLEISFLPETPPEPLREGFVDLQVLLDGSLKPYITGKKPDAAFLRSIETWGIRDPVILGAAEENFGFNFDKSLRLLDGRRRLQAAITLDLEQVPYKIYNLSNISNVALILDSNVQRSSNPIAEYEAILEFIVEAKAEDVIVDEKDISQATGMKVQTIRKRMKLSQVPHEIIDAVAERKVALGVAESIATLNEYQKGQLLDKFRDVGKLTGNDVHEVKQVKRKEAIEGIPSDVFDLPEFDPEHQHQFKPRRVANMGFRCSCGRVLSQDEAINLLNVYLD